MIFSAVSPLLVSASEAASAICSAGCLAMVGNPSKTRFATLPRSRWQESDTSDASCHIDGRTAQSATSERRRNAACGLLRALDDQIEDDGSCSAKNSHPS